MEEQTIRYFPSCMAVHTQDLSPGIIRFINLNHDQRLDSRQYFLTTPSKSPSSSLALR